MTAHFCPFFRFRKAVSLLRFGARIAKEAEPSPGPECELVGEKNILFVEDVGRVDESSKENAEEAQQSEVVLRCIKSSPSFLDISYLLTSLFDLLTEETDHRLVSHVCHDQAPFDIKGFM